jgi:hypothetical protein
MNVGRLRWRAAAVLGAATVAAACSDACPRTNVELTAHGGFAYIEGPSGTVNIAFLKDVDKPAVNCTVKQLGVELKVDDGRVVDPPGVTSFDPVGSVMSFEGANTSGVTLIGTGKASAPFRPANPMNEDDWKDLKWTANTRHMYPGNPVSPNWPTLVNGYVQLTQGLMQAGKPSDAAAVLGTWTFQKTPADNSSFEQAISDRTRYLVTLRSRQVVIKLTGPSGAVKRIVIEPTDARRTVGLVLIGKHPPQTPAIIRPGEPIAHFCAYYELLTNPVAEADRFIPHFKGATLPTTSSPGAPAGAGPSPGAFCPGDWP